MKFPLLFVLLLSFFPLFAGGGTPQRYAYAQPHMGTTFRIILYADNEETANNAANAAFSRVAELNQILSDYLPHSELSRLSATAGTGQVVKLSPDLWYLLHKSLQISAATNGAFDVTVGPLVQLWRRARRQHELPPAAALAAAKAAVGYQHVQLDLKNHTAQLLVPGMQLDMGAIGKGYAVDEAMKVLKSYKIKSALIDGGGNILVSQAPPGGQGWGIELLPATGTNLNQSLKIKLKNRGVATSGDLYQYVEINGLRYSHILNPFTGLGLTDRSRVSIIAKNATVADWLSTSLSVLDSAAGQALLKKEKKAAAFIQKASEPTPIEWRFGKHKKYTRQKLLL